jgi:hypothetical protein
MQPPQQGMAPPQQGMMPPQQGMAPPQGMAPSGPPDSGLDPALSAWLRQAMQAGSSPPLPQPVQEMRYAPPSEKPQPLWEYKKRGK